ncbi:MAG: DHA2 family efflux MFS transporter permease subunit [Alphaproteobacteria bacterium]|nr:DHA2 family efflux MFS transporter permease subunit [Alphaproteobacteria bacterium]
MTASILATGMTALDMTIGAVALPYIRGSLSATQDQIGWVLTSYIVATAIVMPASGWLATRFGRKRVYITAMIGFTLASVLCGLAASLSQEVAFRALQGAFGGPLVPLSQTIVLDTYPRKEHGKAISIWGFGVVLGPVLGPTLGGYLTEAYGWPWIFYINVPIGIVAISCALVGLPASAPRKSARLDRFGFLALAIAIAAVQTMLDRGERQDWFASNEILIEAAIAGLALYMLIVHTATARRSFINTEMFADRNFAIGIFLIFAFGFILLPPFVLIPAFLQDLRGIPISTVGILLSPRSLGVMFGMVLAGRLLNHVEPRALMVIGLLLVAWGAWDMAGWTASVGNEAVVVNGVISGFGMGLLYSPLFTLSFATLRTALRVEATGLFQLMRNVGSSVSVAVFLTLFVRNTTIGRASIVEHVTPFNPAFGMSNLGGLWNLQTQTGLAAIDLEVTRQAQMIAYVNDFYLLGIIALAMIPLALLLRRREELAE